jgi:putative membrane protein
MKRMMLVAGVVATVGWLGLGQANAQQPPRPSTPPSPTRPAPTAQPGQQQHAAVPMNPKNDQQFMEWAATRNAMEVEMGQLAARKAPSQQVRRFGQMLATDHGRSNTKAVALAKEMNIRLPQNMAPQDRKTIQEFTGLSGPQFDQRFVQHEIKDHEHVIKVFEKWAKDAKDPAVRGYAEKTIPVLKKHLAAAKRLAGTEHGNATTGHAEEQENQPGLNGVPKTKTPTAAPSNNKPPTTNQKSGQ